MLIVFALLSFLTLRRADAGTRQLAPVWISAGLIAIGSAAMTALARVGIGLEQALVLPKLERDFDGA